jgi:hypothetical protein
MNIYTYIKETIQKHSKYKYKYYQNTHTLQNAHIHHILQNKLKQPQHKIQTNNTRYTPRSEYTQILKELVINTLPGYASISNAAVGDTIYSQDVSPVLCIFYYFAL